MRRQLLRGFAEECLRCGLHAVDAVAELGDIRIDLDDARFGPGQFQQYGEIRLQSFAHETSPVPEKQVLGGLLRDRAGAAQTCAVVGIVHGVADRLEIEAMVSRKFLVFGSDERNRQFRGDIGQRHEALFDCETTVAVAPGRETPFDHESRCRRGKEPQDHDRQPCQPKPDEYEEGQSARPAPPAGAGPSGCRKTHVSRGS